MNDQLRYVARAAAAVLSVYVALSASVHHAVPGVFFSILAQSWELPALDSVSLTFCAYG